MKLAAFLFCLAFSAQAEMLTGYVVTITDGDTIVVLDADRKQYKIRLAGIDTPEEYGRLRGPSANAVRHSIVEVRPSSEHLPWSLYSSPSFFFCRRGGFLSAAEEYE